MDHDGRDHLMKKAKVISFSGKGGSGKTTTASLFLAVILRKKLFKDILVIDADPDANLSGTLNVTVEKTVGRVLDQRKAELEELGAAGPKLRFSLWESIAHADGFDLLVMGRPTGVGCYCSVSSVLSAVLNETLSMYDLVLIDFDAGLEHFNRRTGNPSDTLIITCDPSGLSFDTAKRIRDLVDELSLPYERQYIVGCRFDQSQQSLFTEMATEAGFSGIGMVAYDTEIASRNLEGKDLLSIGLDNPAFQAVDAIVFRAISP